MDGILGMDILETTNELVGEHQHCLERELATAKVEEVLQAWSKEIEHHDVEFAFRLICVDSGNTGIARERLIDLGFTFEDGEFNRHMFEFNGSFLAGVDVGSLGDQPESHSPIIPLTYVDSTEAATTNPPLQTIFTCHT